MSSEKKEGAFFIDCFRKEDTIEVMTNPKKRNLIRDIFRELTRKKRGERAKESDFKEG